MDAVGPVHADALADASVKKRQQRFRMVVAALTVGFWLFNWFILTLSNWLDGRPDLVQRGEARGVAILGAILACWGIHRLFGRVGHWPLWKRAALLFLLSMVVGDGLAWINALALQAAGVPLGVTLPGAILYSVAIWAWLVLAWGSLYFAIAYNHENRERELHWASLQSLAQSAQLRALRYQIRPHFLFNSLNSIASLILESRGHEAVGMLRHLSDFLRKSLELDPIEEVRLEDELNLQALYLKVEMVRFPDLHVTVHVDPAASDVLVPTLILQPLIENAVKFSISANRDKAQISINAHRIQDHVEISVTDNGLGLNCEAVGAGVGLSNVRQRLRQRYGVEHRFEAGPIKNAGFRVWMRLPAEAAI